MAEQKQYCGSGKKSPNHDIVNIVIMATEPISTHTTTNRRDRPRRYPVLINSPLLEGQRECLK